MNFQPQHPEISNVRAQARGSADESTPEPSHIHIPRPSRLRQASEVQHEPVQLALDQAA